MIRLLVLLSLTLAACGPEEPTSGPARSETVSAAVRVTTGYGTERLSMNDAVPNADGWPLLVVDTTNTGRAIATFEAAVSAAEHLSPDGRRSVRASVVALLPSSLIENRALTPGEYPVARPGFDVDRLRYGARVEVGASRSSHWESEERALSTLRSPWPTGTLTLTEVADGVARGRIEVENTLAMDPDQKTQVSASVEFRAPVQWFDEELPTTPEAILERAR